MRGMSDFAFAFEYAKGGANACAAAFSLVLDLVLFFVLDSLSVTEVGTVLLDESPEWGA